MYRQNPAHTARTLPGATITSQPWTKTTIGAGFPFTLSVTAENGLAYQWYKDGAPIAGATDSSHAVAAATSADAGTYTVVVTGTGGGVTSTPARVSVEPPEPAAPLPVLLPPTAFPAALPPAEAVPAALPPAEPLPSIALATGLSLLTPLAASLRASFAPFSEALAAVTSAPAPVADV